MLKSDDEMLVYQGAMELRDSLSYAQENQMQGFLTDQYMDILVKIVGRDALTDLSNEVKFFAIQSLTTLMDIFPTLVNHLVSLGFVANLNIALQNSEGFIDLTEACIKSFEKVVLVNPSAVLKSGALGLILQQIDFFEVATQQRVYRIIEKIARHSASEAEFDQFILPVIPYLVMNLSIDEGNQQENKKLEDISKIIFEIQESFFLFNSLRELKKIGIQFEKLIEYGLFDVIIGHIENYCQIQNQQIKNKGKEEIEINNNKQISSTKQSQSLSQQILVNFLKIVENACKYSIKVSNKVFSESTLINDLAIFLPSEQHHGSIHNSYNSIDFPLISEVIQVYNALISDKENLQQIQDEGDDKNQEKQIDPALAELEKQLLDKQEFQNMKREFQKLASNKQKIKCLAEVLLPRLFFVHENITITQFRIRTLQLIDKIIDLFDQQLLQQVVEPTQFAKFIQQILITKQFSSIEVSLQITRKILDSSPMSYVVQLIREGVSAQIAEISTPERLKSALKLKEDLNICEGSFDIEIYQVKDALNKTRLLNPDDYHTKDFYERRLIELVERQKKSDQIDLMRLKHKSLNASKNEADHALPSLIAFNSSKINRNCLPNIFKLCQGLQIDYFENINFINEIQEKSVSYKKQLGLLEELSMLSKSLCIESANNHECFEEVVKGELFNLLQKIAELLTEVDFSITSYEFKGSNILYALELLLTKTPSQIKQQQLLANEKKEEIKQGEQERQKKFQISKNEANSMMNRFKIFSHVFITTKSKQKQHRFTAMQALIEASQRIISENDSLLLNIPSNNFLNQESNLQQQNGFFNSQSPVHDYDNYMNALRQLQKRVTINLIYDPNKSFQNPDNFTQKQVQLIIKKENDDEFNVQMETGEKNNEKEDSSDWQDVDDEAEERVEMQLNLDKKLSLPKMIKHSQSLQPNFQGLAGSPNKNNVNFIQKAYQEQQLLMSKVYLKRHHLYSQLKQIPVTVEQSSCVQILEDFLRNRIKTIENVKELRLDYGMPPSSAINQFFGKTNLMKKEIADDQPNYLEMALKSQSNSITQKIVLAKMSNGSRKLLDKLNIKLVQILSQHSTSLKHRPKKTLKLSQEKKNTEKRIKTMEKENLEEMKEHKDSSSSNEDPDQPSEEDYDQEMHHEEDEEDLESEIIREEAVEGFIEEAAKDILESGLPDDQQQFLVKALQKQHVSMLGFLENQGSEDAPEKLTEDQLYELQNNISDFQDAMTGVSQLFRELHEFPQHEHAEDQEMTEEQPIEIRVGDEGEVGIEEERVSQQTSEVLVHDLEELIKQQGEDIDFEFFFEGKPILLGQTLFEIIREAERKRIKQEAIQQKVDSIKYIQHKEQEISKKVQKLSDDKQSELTETQQRIEKLKREAESLRDVLAQIQKEIATKKGMSAPHSLFSVLSNAHKIYFCIKDKPVDNVIDQLKQSVPRARFDSLIELTSSPKKLRSRTKSEAVQDISSASINDFVAQILKQEFKVFDEDDNEQLDTEISKDQDLQDGTKSNKKILSQSLKILKVINFLYGHSDLISSIGLKLIMKKGYELTDQQSISFNDIELFLGMNEIQSTIFQNSKLDSYLQRSIKDPYVLIQGVSPQVQSIFKNCPFLFPFSTKQMYFKLVSFIFAIDVHRSIFFLRQYIKQQAGNSYNQKSQQNEKDNLKKITKQKATIQRDKIIQSAFTVISKIDKKSFLELEFAGEEGTGLGPTLEFYDNIAEEFKNWSIKNPLDNSVQTSQQEFKMWRLTNDNLLFPFPLSLKSVDFEVTKQIYEIFRLCGTIVAKAIVDDRQIDLPISPLFWRLCIGSQMSIFDLQKLDKQVYETMAEFQIIANRVLEIEYENFEDSDFKQKQLSSLVTSKGAHVEDYGLVFTLPTFDQIELIEGGNHRIVTIENVQDYVDLVLHQTFHESIKMQVQAFKKGFNAIFPISSLKPFTISSNAEEELEKMVCGVSSRDPEWKNREELILNIQPDHGYTRNSSQYVNFIRYILELDDQQRPLFIKFLTGSKRLPLGGFKNLSPNLTFVLKKCENSDNTLPSVMACQNYLKCPIYSSYEILKKQFDFAVKEGQQNFTLS